MFNDVSKYVSTLCDLNITSNQFLLCYLLHMDEKKDGKYQKRGKEIANLYRYASHNKGHIKWTKEEIRDLVDKGYLIDPYYTNNKSYPDYLEVTEKFKDKIFASKDRFQQLNEVYPALIQNFKHPSGPKIKLKVCDLDKMEKLYKRKVRTKALHNTVLEVVEWAVENKQLNTSLENFIRGNLWNTYKEQMEEYEDTSNMNVAR